MGLQADDMRRPLMTIDELATWLAVPACTIYNWVNHGQIPHIKVRRCLRFDPEAIERWLAGSTMVEAEKR
jgi:excisionase family DNA binding protein